jgi:hypothetical protein
MPGFATPPAPLQEKTYSFKLENFIRKIFDDLEMKKQLPYSLRNGLARMLESYLNANTGNALHDMKTDKVTMTEQQAKNFRGAYIWKDIMCSGEYPDFSNLPMEKREAVYKRVSELLENAK